MAIGIWPWPPTTVEQVEWTALSSAPAMPIIGSSLSCHALPKETSNYVPIILAITIMAKNPEDYGLQNVDDDPCH